MDRYDPNRDITETFVETVCSWIRESGEVLLVLRYLRAAGKKEYVLCKSELDFRRAIELVSIGTDIIAFRKRQLPMRGVVDNAFIERALTEIADGEEYLVVRLARKIPDDPRLWGEMGDTHRDLKEELEYNFDSEVAVGICPPFNDGDDPNMISASKGGIDGPR